MVLSVGECCLLLPLTHDRSWALALGSGPAECLGRLIVLPPSSRGVVEPLDVRLVRPHLTTPHCVNSCKWLAEWREQLRSGHGRLCSRLPFIPSLVCSPQRHCWVCFCRSIDKDRGSSVESCGLSVERDVDASGDFTLCVTRGHLPVAQEYRLGLRVSMVVWWAESCPVGGLLSTAVLLRFDVPDSPVAFLMTGGRLSEVDLPSCGFLLHFTFVGQACLKLHGLQKYDLFDSPASAMVKMKRRLGKREEPVRKMRVPWLSGSEWLETRDRGTEGDWPDGFPRVASYVTTWSGRLLCSAGMLPVGLNVHGG